MHAKLELKPHIFLEKNISKWKEFGWNAKNSDKKLKTKWSIKTKSLGLHDIYGNVAEWTLDQYQADFYASIEESTVNPWRKPIICIPGLSVVVSYRDDPKLMRSSLRMESTLDWKKRDPQIPKSFWWNTDSPFVGFRIIRPLNPTKPGRTS